MDLRNDLFKHVTEVADKNTEEYGIFSDAINGAVGITLNLMGFFAAKGLQDYIDSKQKTPLDDLIDAVGTKEELMELFETYGNLGYDLIEYIK